MVAACERFSACGIYTSVYQGDRWWIFHGVQKLFLYSEDLWHLFFSVMLSLPPPVPPSALPFSALILTELPPVLMPPSVVSRSSERDIRGLSELSGVFPRQRLRALSRATLPVPAERWDVSPWYLSPRLPCRTLRTEREGHQPLHEYVWKPVTRKNVGIIHLQIQIRQIFTFLLCGNLMFLQAQSCPNTVLTVWLGLGQKKHLLNVRKIQCFASWYEKDICRIVNMVCRQCFGRQPSVTYVSLSRLK